MLPTTSFCYLANIGRAHDLARMYQTQHKRTPCLSAGTSTFPTLTISGIRAPLQLWNNTLATFDGVFTARDALHGHCPLDVALRAVGAAPHRSAVVRICVWAVVRQPCAVLYLGWTADTMGAGCQQADAAAQPA